MGIVDELVIYDYCVSSSEIENIYNEYVKTGYTMTLLSKDMICSECNFSVYKNDIFDGQYKHGDIITLDNTYDYTIILHEDFIDDISNIDNIPQHMQNNSSLITYVMIFAGILGLILFIFRGFKW